MISLGSPITPIDNNHFSLIQNNNSNINNNNAMNDNNNDNYLLSKEEITNNINDVRKELEELSLVNNSGLEIYNNDDNNKSKSTVKIKNIPLITEENDVLDKSKKNQQETLLNSLLIELEKEKENYDKFEVENIEFEDLNASLAILKMQNQMLIERIENSKLDVNIDKDLDITKENIELNKNIDNNNVTTSLTEIEILSKKEIELNYSKDKLKKSIRILEVDKLNYYNQMKITDNSYKQQRILEKIIIKEFNIINLKLDDQNSSYKSKIIQYDIDELESNIINENKANLQSLLDNYDIKKQEIIDDFNLKKNQLDENTLIIEQKLDLEKSNLKSTLDDKDKNSLILVNKLNELDIEIDNNQALMNEYYIKEKQQVKIALDKIKYEQDLLNKQLEESIINEKAELYEQLLLEENNRIKSLNKDSSPIVLAPKQKELTDEERNLIFQQLLEEDDRINNSNNKIDINNNSEENTLVNDEKLYDTLEFLGDVANNKERYSLNPIKELNPYYSQNNENNNDNIGFMVSLNFNYFNIYTIYLFRIYINILYDYFLINTV
jgi:hypothetical protein